MAGVLNDASLEQRWRAAPKLRPVVDQPRAAIWSSAAWRLTLWPGFST